MSLLRLPFVSSSRVSLPRLTPHSSRWVSLSHVKTFSSSTTSPNTAGILNPRLFSCLRLQNESDASMVYVLVDHDVLVALKHGVPPKGFDLVSSDHEASDVDVAPENELSVAVVRNIIQAERHGVHTIVDNLVLPRSESLHKNTFFVNSNLSSDRFDVKHVMDWIVQRSCSNRAAQASVLGHIPHSFHVSLKKDKVLSELDVDALELSDKLTAIESVASTISHIPDSLLQEFRDLKHRAVHANPVFNLLS